MVDRFAGSERSSHDRIPPLIQRRPGQWPLSQRRSASRRSDVGRGMVVRADRLQGADHVRVTHRFVRA